MTSNAPGSGRDAKSRWSQLARRGEQPAEAVPELRAVPVRPAEPTPEEHHLGDRLSAYLDGELGHDSRERVQAHLATCPECLAEAESGRAVKHLLTRTDTPGPSSHLMARLMAVAALPEDDHPAGGPGGPLSTASTPPGSLGGSRLDGGSFGRGPGASFGGGALGADSPIPGIDPRALPIERPSAQRGRRLVFAAAGAFSVAAVTLSGFGSVPALGGDEQHATTVTPISGPGRSAVVPMSAELSVDYPVRQEHGSHPHDVPPPQPATSPIAYPYRTMLH